MAEYPMCAYPTCIARRSTHLARRSTLLGRYPVDGAKCVRAGPRTEDRGPSKGECERAGTSKGGANYLGGQPIVPQMACMTRLKASGRIAPTFLTTSSELKVKSLSVRIQLFLGSRPRSKCADSSATAPAFCSTDVMPAAMKSECRSGAVRTRTGRFLVEERSENGNGIKTMLPGSGVIPGFVVRVVPKLVHCRKLRKF